MSTQYSCQNERRRQAILDHATLNGIDFLEVLDQDAPSGSPLQQTLLIRFLKALPTIIDGDNVRIDGGVRVTPVAVEWAARASDAADLFTAGRINADERDFLLAQPNPDQLLVARTDAAGDFSTYRLRLVTSPTQYAPPPGFDPILSEVAFSFKVECPSDFDCQPEEECPPPVESVPAIDYLVKDYASFRKLILDRLAVIMPDWRERSPADLNITLVELLAYAGDYLSYYQDAAATEAYLGTARRRTSVRRHARMLDYPMHDGCNARTWVHFKVTVDGVQVDKGTSLLTPVTGFGTRIAPNSTALAQALTQQPVVFATMHDATFYLAHNEIEFYTWGDENCCLPSGATRATFTSHLPNLKEGDVLVFVEKRGPANGKAADADPAHRQSVRLATVTLLEDPLGGRFLPVPTDDPVPVTEITWLPEDALSFPLCVSLVKVPEEELAPGDPVFQPVSVALGNIVLADQGAPIVGEKLDAPFGHLRYRPRLEQQGITFRIPYDDEVALQQPAVRTISQDPRQALPDVLLLGDGESWAPQRDLLGSDRFATEFVVETESDGRAFLRFGDGVFGREPAGVEFQATYRIGSGTHGNLGADALAHVVTNDTGVEFVRNPLQAAGGTDPESLEEVRQYAPQAFRTQERAVTEADYATVAERHSEIQRAVATRRWTGSWYTMFVTVDRKRGLPVDARFEAELRRWLERFRLAGHDLEIDGPKFVPLEIVLTVCVTPGYFKSDVKQALLEVFSSRDLPDGRRGFFHPDNFTFGQTVYLSEVIATAMDVPGVLWVDADDTAANSPNRFRRWGELAHGEIAAGMITMDRLEIARLDNDPSLQENGRIDFNMLGGV